jgi:hypothetical protein
MQPVAEFLLIQTFQWPTHRKTLRFPVRGVTIAACSPFGSPTAAEPSPRAERERGLHASAAQRKPGTMAKSGKGRRTSITGVAGACTYLQAVIPTHVWDMESTNARAHKDGQMFFF